MRGSAKAWLERIRGLPLERPLSILNVCGGHERTLAQAGLRAALPETIRIIPGPGCPVCVCPEEDVYEAIRLALEDNTILVAFGDMLRVPVNVAKGEVRSLSEARAKGADVRPIASPREAVAIAQTYPTKRTVFFAAGFETTMAPVASMLCEGVPENLLLLLSGRLTWPAVDMLLASEAPGFEALIAPGHVATVMGPEEWSFVADQYGMPAAVAGFTAESLLAAIHSVLTQLLAGTAVLENCYPASVRRGGNRIAKQYLSRAMRVVDANWRAIGTIARSGFALVEAFASHDARSLLALSETAQRRRAGEMPPGCDCARVVLGKVLPTDCKLYGKACTPRSPIGPCMVSDEGACHIWWTSGIRDSRSGRQGRPTYAA
ncbi:MAG: hydrogenase formation protein HypD [Rhodospirillales bacterium]|nr:hydrogenase formation protein HypD [Rhodospirillales bacterium]